VSRSAAEEQGQALTVTFVIRSDLVDGDLDLPTRWCQWTRRTLPRRRAVTSMRSSCSSPSRWSPPRLSPHSG